jgi:hypothetical protein
MRKLKQRFIYLILTILCTGVAAQTKTINRVYELRDPRFCEITPAPFICQQCLAKGFYLQQQLKKLASGGWHRSYLCGPRIPTFFEGRHNY